MMSNDSTGRGNFAAQSPEDYVSETSKYRSSAFDKGKIDEDKNTAPFFAVDEEEGKLDAASNRMTKPSLNSSS